MIRGLSVGVDAFNRWSFVNRGDLDGQWQLVDTWDVEAEALLPVFSPHPNSYVMFGLISRFTAKLSEILRVSVVDGAPSRHIFATALRSPSGELTVLVINDGDANREIRVHLTGLSSARTLFHYRVGPRDRDRANVRLDPLARSTLSPSQAAFEDTMPGSSITVYTTYELSHDDPGVTTDP